MDPRKLEGTNMSLKCFGSNYLSVNECHRISPTCHVWHLGKVFAKGKGCPIPCRAFGCTHGLCPLEASTLPTQLWQSKVSPDIIKWEAKIPPCWESLLWYIPEHLLWTPIGSLHYWLALGTQGYLTPAVSVSFLEHAQNKFYLIRLLEKARWWGM